MIQERASATWSRSAPRSRKEIFVSRTNPTLGFSKSSLAVIDQDPRFIHQTLPKRNQFAGLRTELLGVTEIYEPQSVSLVSAYTWEGLSDTSSLWEARK